ncbi:MAG: universal stress protein, partial [Anaerolineae bacterium]
MTPLENRPSRAGKGIVMVAVRDAQDMGPLLRIGCSLARAHDAEVRVVTVTTSGSPPSWLSIPEICEDLPVETIVREGRDVARIILEEVQKTEVHTLILGWGGEVSRGRYRLGRTLDPVIQGAPSEVLLVRSKGLEDLDRLLIPLAGGPNAPRALGLARAIAPDAEITALYVAAERLGDAEILVGEERLETILAGLEESTGIEPRVVQASDPVAGILQEAKEGYDLILLGAGGEDFIDRFLFGDVVQGVLAGTTAPTAVVRRSLSSLGTLQRRIWMRIFRSGPTLTTQQQATVYKNIRRGARPSTDFWVMIALASAIAAL